MRIEEEKKVLDRPSTGGLMIFFKVMKPDFEEDVLSAERRFKRKKKNKYGNPFSGIKGDVIAVQGHPR